MLIMPRLIGGQKHFSIGLYKSLPPAEFMLEKCCFFIIFIILTP